jgi:hypothetical protein
LPIPPAREVDMVVRRLAAFWATARVAVLAIFVLPGSGCVTTDTGKHVLQWQQKPSDTIRLTDAEQMIDELDRVMTMYGTISVKTPDVWGQDRLAKFRSEYELQMAEWLRHGFKTDINASVRRSEVEATQIQVGGNFVGLSSTPPRNASGSSANQGGAPSTSDGGAGVAALSKSLSGMNAGAVSPTTGADKAPIALEPTVVLDEHSSYLNHLNQLRRINAGDELADRPGYGLYLIRIPVTLSPGPRSRRGKGAIITVSASPVMSKHTMRNALRNAVINESVNNLTQAVSNQSTSATDRTSAMARGAFSLVAFADNELFYGKQNIQLLRQEAEHQLARDLSGEPHHRNARIAEWLRGELEASYHFLEEAATPRRSAQLTSSTDPLEELGNQVARRDFSRIAQIRSMGLRDSQVKRVATQELGEDAELGARRERVIRTLALALQIQAAGLSRRLKQDIVDQGATVEPEALSKLSFFEPEVSDGAFLTFQKYVNTKWPLRVYAIEPVIAQQNVADAFGRSKRTAFDLLAAGPMGPWKAMMGMAADRRAADDETAIRLNPTMVGFGAGQSTFGWVFYPRLQTSGSSGDRLLTDLALLLKGRVVDPTGGDQSIEPGQRECTALVEMPNFVPKIEFITVANWFRTSEVSDGQKSELEKATILGRKLVAAESALNKAKIEGQYREEEYQIAMDRIRQLRDLMPTQRLVVRVPFSGDHNDSRIFCSQGLQLRPALLGWHGKPPEPGEESTVFVEGNNFSVHDTHVIAGGKLAKSVLISRHVLEVTIAKEATPTPSIDGDPLLDINVATPNGVSNHLLIKMAAPRAEKQPANCDKKEERREEKKELKAEHRAISEAAKP